MTDFDRELNDKLESLRHQGLLRRLAPVDSAQSSHLAVSGKALLNFSSNDYLGLANEPALREAAVRAVQRYGAGTGASRLVCGSLRPHCELEETVAAFKNTAAALCFSTGYAAATGTICALLGPDDTIVTDELIHASIVDAARLSRATIRVFKHNDLNALESILESATNLSSKNLQGSTGISQNHRPRVLVVTESVFSMDGDLAPLEQIVSLKEQYGAWLMVDEAHATGLYGRHRRGLAEEQGVADQIEIQLGTLSKAVGASGGFICGSRTLIDFLINRARPFIFSTAPVPAAAAAATAGIRFIQSEAGEQRLKVLWQRVAQLNSNLFTRAPAQQSAIIPLIVGDENQAVEMAAGLRAQGIFIPAIRYPSVPRDSARLRLTISANHTEADMAALLAALHTTEFKAAFGPGQK